MVPLLVTYHIRLFNAAKSPSESRRLRSRLLAALHISGKGFHHDHQHRGLVRVLQSAGWSAEDIKAIEEACLLCKEEHDKSEAEGHERYRREAAERETEMYWQMMDDDEEEPAPPAEPAAVAKKVKRAPAKKPARRKRQS